MDYSSNAMDRGVTNTGSAGAKAGAYVGAEYLSAVQQAAGSQVRPGGPQAAASATDGLLSFNQDNYEAMVRSSQVFATGAQEMHRDLAAAARSSLDDARDAMTAFASARSIKDLMDVQASLFRSAMDKAIARNMHMASSSIKLTQQAMMPINARITAAAKGLTPTF